MKAFFDWLKSLFTKPVKVEPLLKVNQTVTPVPAKQEEKERVKPIYKAELEKHKRKKETDATFSEWVRSNVKKFLGYKPPTIATSTYAWCGYIIVVVLGVSGYQYQKDGEMARGWRDHGNAIEWRTNGVPEGAIVWINHKADCNSSSSNHVALADGDCAPGDLTKSGATINLLGGNQNNEVNVTTYPVKEICGVRWPKENGAIPKITKSINCTSGKSTGGTTR
jgi:hypothetical protein